MSKLDWTKGQRECMSLFRKWIRNPNKQTFEYAGAAGTGKTTIVPKMLMDAGIDIDREVLVMAFTGRAASNLSLKGIPATSMHSALMDIINEEKRDSHGRIITLNGRPLTTLKMIKKSFLPKDIKLLFIDEGTFVDDKMANIAKSFGLPVCVAGDLAQLGPIYGNPVFLKNPDYELDEITRQAKGSGIIELATRIRLGQEIPNELYAFGNDAFIIPKTQITDTVLENIEMIVCRKNKTRNYFNRRIREDIMGINSKLPVKGDKLICRHNYWNRTLGGIPLTNGILGYVEKDIVASDINIADNTVGIRFRPDYSPYDYYDELRMSLTYFNEPCGSHPSDEDPYRKGIKMELGHAITTYISQGSQFESVLAWDEPFGTSEDIRKHRYTAITRAEKIAIFAI